MPQGGNGFYKYASNEIGVTTNGAATARFSSTAGLEMLVGNVSGSATSTGSFGRGVIADTLRINKVNASATPLMIGAPSSNMALFHISNDRIVTGKLPLALKLSSSKSTLKITS